MPTEEQILWLETKSKKVIETEEIINTPEDDYIDRIYAGQDV